jgi:hypothetical protein
MKALKSFREFTAESYSMPRALGNGLHGNLRYAGATYNPGLPAASPKKPDTHPKPLTGYQAKILQAVKSKQGDLGVSLDSLVGADGPTRAVVRDILKYLVTRGEISKRTHKQAGADVTKYFVNSEN